MRNILPETEVQVVRPYIKEPQHVCATFEDYRDLAERLTTREHLMNLGNLPRDTGVTRFFSDAETVIVRLMVAGREPQTCTAYDSKGRLVPEDVRVFAKPDDVSKWDIRYEP